MRAAAGRLAREVTGMERSDRSRWRDWMRLDGARPISVSDTFNTVTLTAEEFSALKRLALEAFGPTPCSICEIASVEACQDCKLRPGPDAALENQLKSIRTLTNRALKQLRNGSA